MLCFVTGMICNEHRVGIISFNFGGKVGLLDLKRHPQTIYSRISWTMQLLQILFGQWPPCVNHVSVVVAILWHGIFRGNYFTREFEKHTLWNYYCFFLRQGWAVRTAHSVLNFHCTVSKRKVWDNVLRLSEEKITPLRNLLVVEEKHDMRSRPELITGKIFCRALLTTELPLLILIFKDNLPFEKIVCTLRH